jgi:hypothetical protein
MRSNAGARWRDFILGALHAFAEYFQVPPPPEDAAFIKSHIMADLDAKLQELSLVSKIASELENHLGVSDPSLVEFILDLANKNSNAKSFW